MKRASFTDMKTTLLPEGETVSRSEVTRLIRQGLAAEQDAIHIYEFIRDVCGDNLIKESMKHIADEERVHVGELQALLEYLLEDEKEMIEEGFEEFEETKEKVIKFSSEESAIQHLANVLNKEIKILNKQEN